MKIKKYSCEQFAGIREKEVEFKDGINVILGNNESGKSTVIAGIYNTLITKRGIGGTTDKNKFEKLYLPSNGAKAIDGKLELNLHGEDLVIDKEWVATSLTKLNVNGIREKNDKAEEELDVLLKYGSAFYNNVVFGRQNNSRTILEWALNEDDLTGTPSEKKKKKEQKLNRQDELSLNLDEYVRKDSDADAISAMSGISKGKLEEKLKTKIEKLDKNGKWNFEAKRPTKNSGKTTNGRWNIVDGETSMKSAYYDLEDAQKQYDDELAKIEDYMKLVDTVNGLCEEFEKAKDEQNEFQKNRSKLEKKEYENSRISELVKAIEDESIIRDSWPKYSADLASAKDYSKKKKEKDNVDQRRSYDTIITDIEKSQVDIQNWKSEIEGLKEISEDLVKINNAETDIETDKVRLGAGELHGKIEVAENYKVNMKDCDGEISSICGKTEYDINGFLQFEIPGVVKLVVAPAEIDIETIEQEIKDKEDIISNLYMKYKVQNKQEIIDLGQLYSEKKGNVEEQERGIKRLLNGRTMEELIELRDAIVLDDSIEEIEEDLDTVIEEFLQLRNKQSLELFIGACDQICKSNDEKYYTVELLKERITNREEELSNLIKEQEEYNSIIMPDGTVEEEEIRLKGKVQDTETQYLKEYGELKKLEQETVDIDLAGLEDTIQELSNTLNERIELWSNYKRIYGDLLDLREKAENEVNTMEVFRAAFDEYIRIITNNRVEIETFDGKSGAVLKSKDNSLKSSNLLSEGTKETLILAYRLAMLKFYYPEGNGCVVLDDILLDMDPERREKSVELIKAFARENQVIFTTCDPAIADMLGGNKILV